MCFLLCMKSSSVIKYEASVSGFVRQYCHKTDPSRAVPLGDVVPRFVYPPGIHDANDSSGGILMTYTFITHSLFYYRISIWNVLLIIARTWTYIYSATMSGLPNSTNHPENTKIATTTIEITNGFQIMFHVSSWTNSKLKPTIVKPNRPDTAIMARNVFILIPFLDKKVNTRRSAHATSKKRTGQKVNDLVLFLVVMLRLLWPFLKAT